MRESTARVMWRWYQAVRLCEWKTWDVLLLFPSREALYQMNYVLQSIKRHLCSEVFIYVLYILFGKLIYDFSYV